MILMKKMLNFTIIQIKPIFLNNIFWDNESQHSLILKIKITTFNNDMCYLLFYSTDLIIIKFMTKMCYNMLLPA